MAPTRANVDVGIEVGLGHVDAARLRRHHPASGYDVGVADQLGGQRPGDIAIYAGTARNQQIEIAIPAQFAIPEGSGLE